MHTGPLTPMPLKRQEAVLSIERASLTEVRKRTWIPLAFLIALWADPAAAHGDFAWIGDGNYKAADGTHCCGISDCVEVKPGDLVEGPSGFSTPYGTVHRGGVYQSRDGKAWVCRRQQGAPPQSSCAFVPGGG